MDWSESVKNLPWKPLLFALLLTGSESADPPLTVNAEPLQQPVARTDPAQLVEAVVHHSNAERARHGLGPLYANWSLMQAAQAYAEVLRQGSCFDHYCDAGPRERAQQAGYPDFVPLSENIAAGQQSAEAVVRDWITSPGHRANLLHPDFREIGVGLAIGGATPYWVQVLGAQP